VPLYEYECTKCHKRTEKIEPVAGPHLKKCPHCGGKVESVITAPSIQFKGAGWYVTDYAGKKSAGSEGKPAEKESGNDTGKDAAKDSGTDAPKESAKASDAKQSKDKKSVKK
jgi:putative FmdB family regulatory protein